MRIYFTSEAMESHQRVRELGSPELRLGRFQCPQSVRMNSYFFLDDFPGELNEQL